MTSANPGTATPRPHTTMKQVATLAGVGTKTVSRVINSEPNVSEETARKVWDAVRTLDYHVDMQAGSLRRAGGRTLTLGLLISSVDNPFAGGIHRAVETVCTQRGMAVIASSMNEDPQREVAAVSEFMRRRVDGLVLTSVAPDVRHLTPILQRGTPLAFVDRGPAGIDADLVTSDNRTAAALAARHLLSHGHRRVALLTDLTSIPTAADRQQGFLEEFGRWGVPTTQVSVVPDLRGPEAGEAALAELLRGGDPPTAVFSAQNLVTIGALHALRRAGAEHSVALIGFDDIPLADLLDPGVTVIAQEPEEIGRIAAERILRRLDGEDLPVERVIVGTRLIERGSGELPGPAGSS